MKKKLALILAAAVSIMTIPFSAISAANNSIRTDETYYLKNVYSGKYMQIASNQKHSAVTQGDFVGTASQQFKFIAAADGSYAIVPVENTSLRFDINGASAKNGAKLQIFTENAAFARAQTFNLVDNGDGTYRIISKVTNTAEKALEIAGPSKNNGALLQIWDYVGGKNQKWTISTLAEKAAEDQKKAEEEKKKAEEEKKNNEDDSELSSNISKLINLSSKTTKFNVDECIISFDINNNSFYTVYTTDSFKLQKKIDGKWREYYPVEAEFAKTKYGPSAGEYMNVSCDLTDVCSKTPIVGEYRIIKDFTVKNSDIKFSRTFEFELTDDVTSNVGDGTLRTSYFNKTSEFYQVTFIDSSYRGSKYESYEGDLYKIQEILKNILDIKGTAVNQSRWKPEIKDTEPLYEYVFESGSGDVRVSLYGMIGGVGYVALRKDGEVKVRLVVSKSDYNFLKSGVTEKVNAMHIS